MKRFFISIFSIGAFVIFTFGGASRAQTGPPSSNAGYGGDQTVPSASEETSGWPLTFYKSGLSYSIFEPQADSWNGHDFVGRSAVSVQEPGQSEVYGTIGINAISLVDKNTRTVTLANVKITSADFPSARAETKTYLAALRGLPQRVPALSLDRVEGSLTLAPHKQTPRLVNTPPRIITSTRPAVLVSIDGPPAWKPVSGTSLERAINTSVLLLKDPSGRYYLHLFDGYLKANSLEGGHWTVASKIPDGAALAQEQALNEGNVDLMSGTPDVATQKEPSLSTSAVPDVFVATTPAELITFSGPPNYMPIPGTDLLYAENTSANVFKLLTDQKNYVLLAGRWYSAPSMNGPWQFVPGNQLPNDFAAIPDTSPKENVKASVPGTSQAQEALVANSIPQSAAVPRNTQMQNPQMDGQPQLAPIEGTPLHYVANSETPIIEVGPQSWYAVQDGVWYSSTSVNGPWSVATSVPPVIYTIPPSSPLYYLTSVQVYGSDQNSVYDGYTPGYTGTDVSGDGTVVYGTGYNYQPWVGSVWISPPVTWGFGFAPCWTPWCGWGFNCGFGWGCGFPRFGCTPPFPFFGGFRSFHSFGFGHHGFAFADRQGFAHTGVNFFHRGNFSVSFRNHFVINGNHFAVNRFAPNRFAQNRFARVSVSGQFGRAFNSRTGQLVAGQRAGEFVRFQSVRGAAWNSPFAGGFAGRSVFRGQVGVVRPFTTAPMGVARPFTTAPMHVARPFTTAPMGVSRPFNTAPMGVARPFNTAPMGVARPMTPAPNVWRGGTFPGRQPMSVPTWGGQGSGTRSGGWNNGGGGSFRGGGGFQGGGGGGFHGGGGGGHGGR